MSEIQKNIKHFPHTKETKKKIGDIHRGKIVSNKTKEKMRLNNIGKKLSTITKEKIGKSQEKIIYKITNNKIIKQWQSAKYASGELNLPIRKIQYYCRKKNLLNKYNLIYEKDFKK